MNKTHVAVFLAGVCLAPMPVIAGEYNDVFHTATRSGLHLYFGGQITVSEPAANGVVAGGGKVMIDGVHAGDIFAGGGEVTLHDVDTGRAVVGGGKVTISGALHNGVISGGGDVTVTHGTTITNDAVLTGGHVDVDADISGDLIATAETVELAGRVEGDAEVTAKTIVIRPGTEIGGNLTYASPDAFQLPAGVSVKGQVVRADWNARPKVHFGGWRALIAVAGVAVAIVTLAGFVLIGAAGWFLWYLISGPRCSNA